jgi:hypothetical protein
LHKLKLCIFAAASALTLSARHYNMKERDLQNWDTGEELIKPFIAFKCPSS